jgi:putative sterol carrier protein
MTTIYPSSEAFEDLFTRLFEEIATSDPTGMDPLVKKKMVIRFRVTEPDVDMWVDGRSKPVRTSFQDLGTKATLTADLTGDTLHELLLGTLPLGKALSGRRLKVKGSMFKARRLESLLHACQSTYPAMAEAELGET